MESPITYQSELRDYLNGFSSESGYPKRAVTLTLIDQKLIVQYEPRGELPSVDKLRQTGKEIAIASGTGAVVMGGVAMLVGRTLLGGVAARVGVAGAFGAIGLGVLGPAVLIGGTIGGLGYTVYKIGRNREQNIQAQAFGQELLNHLGMFQPESPLPTDLLIVTSSDRHITIIYDPELEHI
ncbi:MAG: hypothetical protein OXI91_11760 [Chloroflexota bacterium]|nr:hypothetical protein [Chloroflexota bacterium]